MLRGSKIAGRASGTGTAGLLERVLGSEAWGELLLRRLFLKPKDPSLWCISAWNDFGFKVGRAITQSRLMMLNVINAIFRETLNDFSIALRAQPTTPAACTVPRTSQVGSCDSEEALLYLVSLQGLASC